MKDKLECPGCDTGIAEICGKKVRVRIKGKYIESFGYFYHCDKCGLDFTDTESDEENLLNIINEYNKRCQEEGEKNKRGHKMDELRKEFENIEKLKREFLILCFEARVGEEDKTKLWLWIQQKLTEARIDENIKYREVFYNLMDSSDNTEELNIYTNLFKYAELHIKELKGEMAEEITASIQLNDDDIQHIVNMIEPCLHDVILDGVEATLPEFARRLKIIINNRLATKAE